MCVRGCVDRLSLQSAPPPADHRHVSSQPAAHLSAHRRAHVRHHHQVRRCDVIGSVVTFPGDFFVPVHFFVKYDEIFLSMLVLLLLWQQEPPGGVLRQHHGEESTHDDPGDERQPARTVARHQRQPARLVLPLRPLPPRPVSATSAPLPARLVSVSARSHLVRLECVSSFPAC